MVMRNHVLCLTCIFVCHIINEVRFVTMVNHIFQMLLIYKSFLIYLIIGHRVTLSQLYGCLAVLQFSWCAVLL